jgi:peptidoglycan/xylan/chitin deacetylase (PgdA/CDA1 family)
MLTAKQVALQVGFRAGLLRLVRRARRHDAIILTFHRFSGDGQGSPRGLPIHRFVEYMQYVAGRCRMVSLHDLAQQLRRGTVRPSTVAVTIDDGYEEVFSLAAPVLRTCGIPASIFVVSDFVDGRLWPWTDQFRFVFDHAPRQPVTFEHRGSPHVVHLGRDEDRQRVRERWVEYAKTIAVSERDDLLGAVAEACGIEIPATPPSGSRPMTWGQLRTLAAEGFDIGAHTRTHPILSRVRPEQIQDEIGGCKEHIERNIGGPVAHFAYPNGRREDYTAEAIEAVVRAGYAAAVTAVAGVNRPETPIFELHRLDANAEDLAHFAQLVSGLELLKTRLRFGLQSPSGEGRRRPEAGLAQSPQTGKPG